MKILMISLGCDKNLVDSEHISGMLKDAGYEFTDDENDADIIIINSCCFILDAKEESIKTVLEMSKYKQSGKCKALVLTGCLSQRYHDEIFDVMPEVDICIGNTFQDRIAECLEQFLKEKTPISLVGEPDAPISDLSKRSLSTVSGYAYLKIAEGCDKRCAYCVIPTIRGSYRSVPIEQLVNEARYLSECGVKELVIVAQETTLYGKDLYGQKSLHILLKKLAEIDGICRIRLMYCYPEEIYDDLIDTMATEPKICNYLDIPIQHASDDILKRMGRKTTRGQIEELVFKLRDKMPDIALRTTLITGFPGETLKDHRQNLDFVEKMRFDRLGVFIYSKEEGTKAALMPKQVPHHTAKRRRDQIMSMQQRIAFENASNDIGHTYKVMIEGRISGENAYVARTYKDAPEVDSNVFVMTDKELMTGDFLDVKVTNSSGYDLVAEPVL